MAVDGKRRSGQSMCPGAIRIHFNSNIVQRLKNVINCSDAAGSTGNLASSIRYAIDWLVTSRLQADTSLVTIRSHNQHTTNAKGIKLELGVCLMGRLAIFNIMR